MGYSRMRQKIKVFISSPYSIGDKRENLKRHMDSAFELMKADFIPFVPLLYSYMDDIYEMSYSEWLIQTTSWIESCDVVLRLPGESNGCEKEEKVARNKGIPIVYSIGALKIWAEDLPF